MSSLPYESYYDGIDDMILLSRQRIYKLCLPYPLFDEIIMFLID